MAEVFLDRGVPARRARLYGAIGVACFVEALTRWLSRDTPNDLGDEIDRALADVADLAAGRGAG